MLQHASISVSHSEFEIGWHVVWVPMPVNLARIHRGGCCRRRKAYFWGWLPGKTGSPWSMHLRIWDVYHAEMMSW